MQGAKSYAKLPGATAPHIGCKEYVMTVASRLYFSSFYRAVYFSMIASSLVCVVWTGVNGWKIPSSVVFISLEIIVSTLLVCEVLLRMMAFKRRFWHKWCNIFDIVALVMSLVSVAMYFNEEGVLGELEEVAADSVLALRNAVQYLRLAIFLKNRSDQPTTIGRDIDFEQLPGDPDDERELMLDDEQELMVADERETMLDAESGTVLGSGEDEEIRIV
uniref:Ion transport domain-containing protein n=1 Tax=Peronospora matthiolae TaxID=2874970 RepID=A0AAV1VLN2_9STRA